MTDLAVRRRRTLSHLRSKGDVRSLTVLVIFLFAIPSNLIVRALGSAGTPALIVGLLMLIGWLFGTFALHEKRAAQPLRIAMLIFVGATAASYIAANTRPIDPVEVSAADRGIITVLAWLGIVLVALDGCRNRSQLDVLMRRITLAGGLLATLGLAQFATGMAFTNYIQIPGLAANSELELLTRSDFNRPSGTAIHPIEFGAVLAMVLPFALHYALHDKHRSPVARWFPVCSIAIAIPISISRSAIISAAVVLVFLIPSWTPSVRRRAYAGLMTLAVLVYLMVPGLLGTLSGLFTGVSSDNSAQSRVDSYRLAFEFISRSPLFGRGFKTFLPEYRILDNQYLGLLIEMGIVGLLALLALQVTSIRSSFQARRRCSDPVQRHLALAFAASVASNAFSLAFYDGFGFPMATGLFFLVMGCAGCLSELVRKERQEAVATG